LLWSIKFPPFGIKHQKGRYIKVNRKHWKNSKKISPPKGKFGNSIFTRENEPISLRKIEIPWKNRVAKLALKESSPHVEKKSPHLRKKDILPLLENPLIRKNIWIQEETRHDWID
jgi:hypothetical protein